MSMYGAGASKAGVNTADTAYFDLHPTGTTTRLKIFQIIVGIVAAPTNAPAFYLARTTSAGTVTSSLAGQQMDPADPASVAVLNFAWSVAPTFTAANKMSTGGLGVAAGGAWVWTFPDDAPLTITNATASGLAVVNATAAGATVGTFTASMLWRE
jgi:hypothetical protein